MTTQAHGEFVPAWTRGDRLRKARTASGLTVKEFSRLSLISEKTINDYEGDRINRVSELRLEKWSTVTNVSLDWLKTGETPAEPGPDGGQVVDMNRYRQTRNAA